jgi:hypothetical protein
MVDAMSNLQKLIESGGIVTNRFGGQSATYSEDKEKEKLAEIVGILVDAINKTINENGHLADGDVCTLIDLKRGLHQAEKIAGE